MNELSRPITTSGLKVVLAATDFSAGSDRALRRAAALAKEAGARLVLLHVVDDDQPAHLADAECAFAESALTDAIREQPDLAGLDCNAQVVRGIASDGIVKVARQQGADLCVIGSHRSRYLWDIIVGTTAERVVRTSPVPVLMVNQDRAFRYATSLAPVELSECSALALSVAQRLGFLQRTRVVVMHVYDAAAVGMLNYAGVDKSCLDYHLVETQIEAVRNLTRFVKSLDLADIDYSTLVKEGTAASSLIVETAAEVRADLVVIGTHARRGVARLLLSSVTEEALRQLQTDVLVIPVRDGTVD